jgi:hypothetical protein
LGHLSQKHQLKKPAADRCDIGEMMKECRADVKASSFRRHITSFPSNYALVKNSFPELGVQGIMGLCRSAGRPVERLL